MTSPAPAGWYADPSGLPALRWWDGQEWTPHVQPGAAGVPPTAISAGWRGGPATKPAGDPEPGPHTVASPTDQFAPTVPSSAAHGAPLPAATGYSQGTAFMTQPVDSVSEQLGYASPAPVTPAPASDSTSPTVNRAVLIGAVSLLINPLLLCSSYSILMGLRGARSTDPDARRQGMLAAGLGATGVLTHAAMITALVLLL
jgi:hypothetical protein